MTTKADFIAWLATNKRRVALVEVDVRVSGSETTLYLSNTGYADSENSRPYSPCIVGSVPMTEELNLDGQASVSWGAIQINNRGGVRDEWKESTYVWANRHVRIYIGDPRWVRSDFYQVFDGIVKDLAPAGDPEKLQLNLLDKLQYLNNPMTETTLGGSTTNKDRLLPLTFGEVFNIEPLLTNPATLEYQVHNGPIEDIIEVRSNGAVTVSITKFLSTGKFTLSTSPEGVNITCSVQGSKPVTYANDIVSLVKLIVKNYGPTTTRFTDADLDLTSLATFAAAHTQPVGLHAPDRMNMLEACQQLASSVGAQVVMTTLGLLRLVQVTLTGLSSSVSVTSKDMYYHTLEVVDRPEVKATFKLGFNRNYTVQETLAGGVVASSVPKFKEEWLTVTSNDSTVASVYKQDAAPEMVETCLQVEADAQTEADRRRDLWKTPRAVYRFVGRAHLLLTELGDAITITHERYGLSAGVVGLVIGVERDWVRGRIAIKVLA